MTSSQMTILLLALMGLAAQAVRVQSHLHADDYHGIPSQNFIQTRGDMRNISVSFTFVNTVVLTNLTITHYSSTYGLEDITPKYTGDFRKWASSTVNSGSGDKDYWAVSFNQGGLALNGSSLVTVPSLAFSFEGARCNMHSNQDFGGVNIRVELLAPSYTTAAVTIIMPSGNCNVPVTGTPV